jgi:ParB family chromosome partitioning protein
VTELLPIDKLRPAPDNPRRDIGDVSELAASITTQGLLQPLLVTPLDGGDYLVVAGHRRLAASKVAGLTDLECSVRELDDVARNEAMLTENVNRCALSALEEAAAYERLVSLGVSQRQIASRIGCSQGHVSKRLALLGLPEEVQEDVDAGGITLGDAAELTKLGDPARVQSALKRSEGYGRTVAEAVAAELRAIECDEVRRQAFEELRAAGTKVVDHPRYGWYDRKERPLGKGYGQVAMTKAKHAKERCHAAAVDEEGAVVYVCTNPRRHAGDENAESAATRAAKAEEARKREERKELKAAQQARTEAMRELLSKRVARTEVLDFVARQTVWASRSGPARLACQLLELEPIPQPYGSIYKDWTATLEAFATASDEQLARAVLALAFALAEETMGNEWSSWDRTEVRDHLRFLERLAGYRLSGAERTKLGEDPGAPLVDVLGEEPA